MKSSEALVNAVQSGDLDQVKKLVGAQPELSGLVTDSGIPISLLAAYYRKAAIFEWLMERREHPSLYEATVAGNKERVQQLLREDPTLINAYAADGFTAISLACYFGLLPMAELLVEHGADVNLVANNPSRIAPLHSAVAANSEPLVRLLLNNGAKVNAAQNGGVTGLHSAAHRGNVNIVNLLLEHGADPDLRMDDGRTALDFAMADGHEPVVKILQDRTS